MKPVILVVDDDRAMGELPSDVLGRISRWSYWT